MLLFSLETLHLLGLLNFFVAIQLLSGWSISVPDSVMATEGSCVVVPCQTVPHSRLIWYMHSENNPKVFDRFYPDTVDEKFRGRTSAVGEAMDGNCSLRIDDVRSDDNVQIYAWINPTFESQAFFPKLVTIKVEKVTSEILVKNYISEGDIFEAHCLIFYSCPSSHASFKWSKSPFLENSTLTAEYNGQNGLWYYLETLHGVVTYKMHESKLSCSVTLDTIVADSEDVILNVVYKPMNVTVTTEEDSITEGDSVMVECVTDCNPEPHMYSWHRRWLGQSEEITSTQGKMSFNNIARDTSFSCVAHNFVGAGESDWLNLVVEYPPEILNGSTCILKGEALRCVCQADASPDAFIYWTVDGKDTMPPFITTASIIVRNLVSGQLMGQVQNLPNVSCKANNSLGSTEHVLPVASVSKISSLNMGLLPMMLLGIPLLLGCAMFIYRGPARNKPQLGEGNIDGSQLRQESLLTTSQSTVGNTQHSTDESDDTTVYLNC